MSPCARSTTARSGTPSIRRLADNFGSANSLLYAYRDYELADTVAHVRRRTSYETGTVLYDRVFAQDSKKVVIDPRQIVSPPATRWTSAASIYGLKPNTDVVLINSLMNVILRTGNLHDQALHRRPRAIQASFQAAQGGRHCRTSTRPRTPKRVTGVPAVDRSVSAAKLHGASPKKTLDPLREGRHLVGHPERSGA